MPLRQHDGEIVLRVTVALLGRTAVPFDCFGEIAHDAGAGAIQCRQLELRAGVALLGGLSKPQRGRCSVAGGAVAVPVIPREDQLCFAQTRFRSRTETAHRRILFRGVEVPLRIEMPELNERWQVARLRGSLDQ